MKNNLSEQMKGILENYTDEVMSTVVEVLGEVAEEAADQLKQTSPRRRKHGGAYARSWSVKEEKQRTFTSEIVFNKQHYQLTHLLEFGHATANGGRRVDPIVHIEPVNVRAEAEAVQKITEAIKRL